MKRKRKDSPEKLLMEIIKLDPVQFLGICKILGIDIYEKKGEEDTPRDFCSLWEDLCDALGEMNKLRRRNLSKLVHAANKKEK